MIRSFFSVFLVAGCAAGPPGTSADMAGPAMPPEFGRTLTVVAGAREGLVAPRALAFAPLHPDQLWVADAALNGAVILFRPGSAMQAHEVRVDAYGRHFMDAVSSLAFGVENRFATCQESRNTWNERPQPPDDFMGPTLWSADLDVFAKVNQAIPPSPLEGSHLDMLHQSPWCMGIAHERDNVYWAFDGLAGDLVRYDFGADHGPGGSSHSDGIVRRYPEATVRRVEGVPGHLALDGATGWLYVADTGGARVMRLQTRSGGVTGKLPLRFEPLREHSKVEGATWERFADGIDRPSGIALAGGRVFVAEHGTGRILAFAPDGAPLGRLETGARTLQGIAVGPDGKLWYVDRDAPAVVRVDP